MIPNQIINLIFNFFILVPDIASTMLGMMQRIQQLEHQQHFSGLRPKQLFHEYARLPRSPESLTRDEVLKAFNASQSRGVTSITAFARNLFRILYTEDEAKSGGTITGNCVCISYYNAEFVRIPHIECDGFNQ